MRVHKMEYSYQGRFFQKTLLQPNKEIACSYPHGRLLALVQSNNLWGAVILHSVAPMHNFMAVSGEDVSGACSGSDFFPVEHGYFITTCSDLLLCGRIPEVYHVGNPITMRWETLPPPPPPEGFPSYSISVGLVTSEEDDSFGGKITNFRVIIATFGKDEFRYPQAQGRKEIPIETYSSRTREWRRSILVSDSPVNVRFGPPSFSGGFLHWLTSDGKRIVAYDPSSLDEEDKEDHRNRVFALKRHVLQVTNTPSYSWTRIIWRSDNGHTLWFCGHDCDRGVEVLRKRDETDEWVLMSRVPSEATMTKDVLGITKKELGKCGVDCVQEPGLWMMAFIPWNPRLIVMRLWNRICVYDCIDRRLDHEVLLEGEYQYRHIKLSWEWTPYFCSKGNSTYNLGSDWQS